MRILIYSCVVACVLLWGALSVPFSLLRGIPFSIMFVSAALLFWPVNARTMAGLLGGSLIVELTQGIPFLTLFATTATLGLVVASIRALADIAPLSADGRWSWSRIGMVVFLSVVLTSVGVAVAGALQGLSDARSAAWDALRSMLHISAALPGAVIVTLLVIALQRSRIPFHERIHFGV